MNDSIEQLKFNFDENQTGGDMKKLFISCPMRGRTEDEIRRNMEKLHKLAELLFDEELEVIPSYIEHDPPKDSNAAIWYLGRSLQMLSEADRFIGVRNINDYHPGCATEAYVADAYGIPNFIIDSDMIFKKDNIEVIE